MCGCLLTYDGGNCCVTYQIVMIQNNLISDYLFELSLWQGMLETLMTVRKHVVGIQIGRHRSVGVMLKVHLLCICCHNTGELIINLHMVLGCDFASLQIQHKWSGVIVDAS